VFATDEKNLPTELSGLNVNIDADHNIPETLEKKTHTMPKTNMFIS